MKIDRSKSKKSSSDVPFDCKILIEEIKSCNEEQLLIVLQRTKTWNCGKCELYHWIDVLDIFDSILEECCRKKSENDWELPVDLPENAKKRELLLAVISFTSLLIEHSFSRHLYNSIEHLITLLSSEDMQIVLAILNLLFVFSKRSNFFTRISTDKRQSLLLRLNYLAQNWGGKEQGFGLAQCCQDLPLSCYPTNASVFNFEFYSKKPNDTTTVNNNNIPAANDHNHHHGDGGSSGTTTSNSTNQSKINRINVDNKQFRIKPVSKIMNEIVQNYDLTNEQQLQIFTQLRLIKNFANYHTRLQCVQARLNALSIMVYCQAMAIPDTYYQLLYNGLIEELVEILELKNPDLIELKSASLKTLTSIIHLDRNSKHKVIIESTGANSYHGFLPILVRNCINSLITGKMDEYPLNFVTALFSFLYHLASCETGCEALVQCGIMESLLRVVDWKGPETDHLTFVTRAVRVIDLLTNQFIDMNAFQSNNGLNIFVQRLEYEVNICRQEQPFEIEVPADKLNREKSTLLDDEDFVDTEPPLASPSVVEMHHSSLIKKETKVEEQSSSSTTTEIPMEIDTNEQQQMKPSTSSSLPSFNNNLQCYPQRAALMKSMLNFLKKAVQCSGFFESVRPLMYGNFPRSLRHIISNAEYYGPSLFLLATDVVSVYVYQEPSLLSMLQDNGLTDVVLHALLVKDVPPTKEVLASLPTVFTSLCLNHRGLEAFVSLRPFERLFKVFLKPDYLQAMRRRRSESIGDTATCLGNSMDELIRHQPSLRIDAIGAIIKLLEEICQLGSDPKYICIKASSKSSSSSSSVSSSSEPTSSTLMALIETSANARSASSNVNNDSSSSEEDDDYDDDTTTTTTTVEQTTPANNNSSGGGNDGNNQQTLSTNNVSNNDNSLKLINNKGGSQEQNSRQQIPLIDYILNVMRFVDAILSNNSTADHCREFLNQNGLEPLFKMLQLPNLPLDFPVMPACFSIASVFKSLLNLAHEKDIFTKGLEKLKEILIKLDPLSQTAKTFNGSILLEDLINHLSSKKLSPTTNASSSAAVNFVTPVLQSMAAAHSYIMMFIHICRTGQGEIRTISMDQWGSALGIEIINLLSNLYIALVWESTLLLGLNDSTSQRYEFVKSQIEKLNSLLKNNNFNIDQSMATTSEIIDNAMSPMDVDCDDAICANCRLDYIDKKSKPSTSSSASSSTALNNSTTTTGSKNPHQKYTKPLLTVASRLGRALAELFGLLVKLCVGSPIRRRSHHSQAYLNGNLQQGLTSKPAQNIAKHLNHLLYNGLSWQPSFDTNIPKFRLTFYVCSIGFSSPMLFDDLKFPYHIMLNYFVKNGGQDAFFDCFKMAFDQTLSNTNTASNNNTNNELPDGIVEFLDSWLLLLEKMTNPQTLLDSPHTIAASKTNNNHHNDLLSTSQQQQQLDNLNFDPYQYLIRTHKKAFPCIMDLWNSKLYKIKCDRVIELLVTIFSHILKGETIVEKKLNSSKTTTTTSSSSNSASGGGPGNSSNNNRDSSLTIRSSSAAAGAASLAPVASSNPDNDQMIQTLIEMGFSRELAIEALLNTGFDLNRATDWILQNNPRYFDNEDEEMIQVIALSLAETRRNENQNQQNQTNSTNSEKELVGEKEEEKFILENELPLLKEELNKFTNNIFHCILKLIDQLPTVVHKCCELLISISKRNGKKWFEDILQQLIEEVIFNVKDLNNKTAFVRFDMNNSFETSTSDWADPLATLPEALKLTSRLHLLILLFNETKHICAKNINNSLLIYHLIDLLENGSYIMTKNFEKRNFSKTPKWIAPIIILLDLYEKNALSIKRRKKFLLDSLNCKRIWKFFEERSGRWCNYTPANNSIIDEAFRNGEQYCRVFVTRKRYTLNFTNMVQVSDESRSYRPIMVFVEPEKSSSSTSSSTSGVNNKDDNKKTDQTTTTTTGIVGGTGDESSSNNSNNKNNKKSKDDSSSNKNTNTNTNPNEKQQQKLNKQLQQKQEEIINDLVEVNFLDQKQCKQSIQAVTQLMLLPIDSETLNAGMRLLLRLTRDYDYACQFVEMNGVNILLKIPSQAQFPGYVTLATLIIRHVLEDQKTLQICMDKILRQPFYNSTPLMRDMHYLFRYFSPACCRDMEIFKKSAMNNWRINLQYYLQHSGGGGRNRMNTSDEDHPILLRWINQSKSNTSAAGAGTTPAAAGTTGTTTTAEQQDEIPNNTKNVISELLNMLPQKFNWQRNQQQQFKESSNEQQTSQQDNNKSSTSNNIADDNNKTSSNVSNNLDNNNKCQDIFYTHTILSILAELTKSYPIVAKVICEYTFSIGYASSGQEERSALSFILDNLLSFVPKSYGDKDSAQYSRALLVAISSVPFCYEVHQTLVMEIKNSLNRAVLLPESTEKHAKIQALSQLIANIVETQQPYLHSPYLRHATAQTAALSPIVKVFLRKNVVTDLAKTIQYLDLSTPMMTATINSLLKTLEFLSKTLNSPFLPRFQPSNFMRSSLSRPRLLMTGAFPLPYIDLEPNNDTTERDNNTTGAAVAAAAAENDSVIASLVLESLSMPPSSSNLSAEISVPPPPASSTQYDDIASTVRSSSRLSQNNPDDIDSIINNNDDAETIPTTSTSTAASTTTNNATSTVASSSSSSDPIVVNSSSASSATTAATTTTTESTSQNNAIHEDININNNNNASSQTTNNTSNNNTLDTSSNIADDQDINTDNENELYDPVAAFDFEQHLHHPRSGTFNSDELRTDEDDEDNDEMADDDDDDHQHRHHHHENDHHNDHGHHHDNTVNSNCIESTSSESTDSTNSDDSDDDDDVELEDDDDEEEEEDDEEEEDADDGAGSTQDEHEEDDDEEEDDDDDDDDEDNYDDDFENDLTIQAFLEDTPFRYYQDNDSLIFNLEEVLPQFFQVSGNPFFFPFTANDDLSMNGLNNSNLPSSSNIQIHHPLLSRNVDNTGASGSIINNNGNNNAAVNSSSSQSTSSGIPFASAINTIAAHTGDNYFQQPAIFSNSGGGGGGGVRTRPSRHRALRSYIQTANNWHIAHFNSRNNPSQILQRLLGTPMFGDTSRIRIGTNAHGGGGGGHGVGLSRPDLVDYRDDYYDIGGNLSNSNNGGGSGGGSSSLHSCNLNTIASTMNRWNEESRLLDSGYLYETMLIIKPEIIKHLEKLKDEELEEKKKKDKELEKEAAAKKSANQSSNTTQTTTSTNNTTTNNTTTTATVTNNATATTETTATGSATATAGLDELQAHIEQLTTSVINQVLESNPIQSNQTAQNNTIVIDATESSQSSNNSNRIPDNSSNSSNNNQSEQPQPSQQQQQQEGMDIVINEEYVPMAVNDNVVPTDAATTTTTTAASAAAVAYQAANEMLNRINYEELEHVLEHFANFNPPTPQEGTTTNNNSTATNTATTNNNNNAEQQQQQSTTTTDQSASQPASQPTTTEAAAAPPPPQPPAPTYQMTPEERAILGDQELPEGVDPSFLAALPENIRQEVIAEQFRLQRLNQLRTQSTNNASSATGAAGSSSAANQSASSSNNATFAEVNPEFLAALPPSIQEEVLAQQRAEQERLNTLNASPDAPFDPDSFFRSLPPTLRRQVLSDIDESQVQLLPQDIANEARQLRREYEIRHRQVHDRLFSPGNALSRIIRSAAATSRRYDALNIPSWTLARLSFRGSELDSRHGYSRGGIGSGRQSNTTGTGGTGTGTGTNSRHHLKGKHLLDYEALSSVMLLLFMHDNLIHPLRLQRLIKNLCFHSATRRWVIQSLLEIIEKTRECTDYRVFNSIDENCFKQITEKNFVSWLSITLDSSFGSRSNVFLITNTNTNNKNKSDQEQQQPQNLKKLTLNSNNNNQGFQIYINPQAAQYVCRNALDILILLAKTFPDQFVSHPALVATTTTSTNTSTTNLQKNTSGTSLNSTPTTATTQPQQESSSNENAIVKFGPSYFEILLRHEAIHSYFTNKKSTKPTKSSSSNQPFAPTFEIDTTKPQDYTPFSQLLNLLAHPFIKKSQMLTDRLIRLMSHISTHAFTPPHADKIRQSSVQQLLQESREFVTEIEKTIAHEHLLKLVVNVITSKTCSEEGLTDATSLLMNLSRLFPKCHAIFYQLLIEAVRIIGEEVYYDINALEIEMKNFLEMGTTEDQATASTSSDEKQQQRKNEKKGQAKNILSFTQDRYTSQTIIINSQTNSKHQNVISGKEVQLPSMSNLISKTSSQFLFLRILKIIMLLREASSAYKWMKEQKQQQTSTAATTSSSSTSAAASASTDKSMEVDNDPDTSGNANNSSKNKNEESRLNNELHLDHLWAKLSDCLSVLSEAPDDHVVLVLQPAVESFFLVHAPDKSKSSSSSLSSNATTRNRNRNRSQLSSGNAAAASGSAASRQQQSTSSTGNNQSTTSSDSLLTTASAAADGNTENDSQKLQSLPVDTQKFLKFAEKHRVVLNQILRQSNVHLANGPFAVLVDHTRILDFDVKRRYFRQELERTDSGTRREDLPVHIRREHVFEDSYREINRRSADDWKNRFYIVFEGEEGQDAGGLLREWYTIISREIFNPNYALFTTSPGDRVTYMINSASHCNSNHLSYFRFVGRVIGKAIHDNKLLDCYFTRSFYKHILDKTVKYTDMESEDYAFYQGLVFLLEHNVNELGTELTFSLEVQEFGVTEVRDLVPDGRNKLVTEENKHEYVKLVCQEKMTGSIKKQLTSFLEGFYEIIPKRLISIFNEHELELLISGLPNIDIDDLKANTDYHKYQASSLQIQWFWRALRTFDQADRAKFLQFVTGTSKVPLQGFSALEGMNGPQKFQIHLDDRSTDRLPSAHTCFNQLDLPAYETYDKLRLMLLKAIRECSEGFGFA